MNKQNFLRIVSFCSNPSLEMEIRKDNWMILHQKFLINNKWLIFSYFYVRKSAWCFRVLLTTTVTKQWYKLAKIGSKCLNEQIFVFVFKNAWSTYRTHKFTTSRTLGITSMHPKNLKYPKSFILAVTHLCIQNLHTK